MINKKASDTKSIVIVDDEPQIREVVRIILEEANFKVKEAGSGKQLDDLLNEERFDLAIVDLNLPDMDGLDIVRNIRQKSSTSVLILSGRSDTTEKIIGLEVGADDFLSKPFDGRELLARVRSIMRRSGQDVNLPTDSPRNIITFEEWTLDLDNRDLKNPENQIVELTSSEFSLLKIFLESPGRILTRDILMSHIYGHDTPAFDRSIDVKIGRLRKKLDASAGGCAMIKTIRGAGYMFSARVNKS